MCGVDRNDRLLSPAELAEYLGVPVQTIYQWRYRAAKDHRATAWVATSGTAGPTSRAGSPIRPTGSHSPLGPVELTLACELSRTTEPSARLTLVGGGEMTWMVGGGEMTWM